MHEHSSGRRWRLPAGTGKLAVTVGTCLCAGQLLVGSGAPAALPAPAGTTAATRTVAAPTTSTALAAERAETISRQAAARKSRAGVGRAPASRTDSPPARKVARKAPVRAGGAGPGGAGPVRVTSGAVGARIIAVARSLSGSPYRYGGTGPRSFDCSGFTQYVFRRFGISLPHQANAQQRNGRAVSRSRARPGDLVFFRNGSYAYHVGIYAGGGYMYDAPRSGRTVGKHKIWSRSYTVRRLV